MKKVILLVMSVIFTLSLVACGDDQKTENGDKSQSNDEELIVGTEAGYEPFEYVGEGGEVVGVDIDIVKEIAKKAGKKLVVKNMNFDGALASVQSGKVDIVAAAVTITPDRMTKMDFSEPYLESEQVVVVNKENPALESTDPKDMVGKIAGVQLGTTGDIWVSDEENVSPADIKKYTQFAQGATDLKNGKIDFMIMDKLPAIELVETTGDSFKIVEGEPVLHEKMALALPKGSDELMKIVNETILELKENGKIDEFIGNHTK